MTDEEVEVPAGPASVHDRIAAFVMLDGMGPDATLAQKSYRLSLCGFRRADIASMLGISAQSVSQNIYTERGKTKKRSPKSAPRDGVS